MLEKKRISERIADIIREKIKHGEIMSGEKLVENVIAEKLGVSRTPIREAFTILVKEGILVSIPHRGVFVSVYNPKDVKEIFELREALESFAAKKAALMVEDKDIVKLRKMFAEFERNDFNDPRVQERYTLVDLNFHRMIASLSGNERLRKIIDQTCLHVELFMRFRLRGDEKISLIEHFEIIDALSRRNPEMAEMKMRDHIRKSLKRILDHFESSDSS